MQTFALTSNIPSSDYGTPENMHLNDLYVNPSGQLAIVTGAYDTLQSVENALQLWLGEYDYNTSYGIPYKILLANPNSNNPLIEYQIRNAILSINSYLTTSQKAQFGIKSIQSLTYEVDRDLRIFNLSAVILLNGNNTPQTISVQV